jgi:AAA+ superfamily predicted ATPase
MDSKVCRVYIFLIFILFRILIIMLFRKTNEILAKYTTELKSILKFYELFQKSSDTLPILLLHGPSGSGKTRCVESVCIDLNLHLCKINAINLAGESSSAVEKRVEIFMRQSLNYGPCIILIKSVCVYFH